MTTRRPCHFHSTALALSIAFLAACPDGNVWLTTDADDTSTGAAPTTNDASTSTTSTGSTSAATDATTTDAATTTTSAEVSACGEPADECTVASREWCIDLADICANTPLAPSPGSGATDYCGILDAQCSSGEASACDECFYLANTCKQLGGGEEACNLIREDCLCRAAAHGLDINN